jgi:hypothetical protein
VNCEFDPVTFWYQAFWGHKDSLHFYEVFNDFVSDFKGFLFGKDPPRISDQVSKFLDKKGTLEKMENYNVIRIFGLKKNPSFIPCHISDRMFIVKVARKYNLWLPFFHDKRKNQFIHFHWKIRDFIFKNINKIDEFANHFHNVILKYDEKIKGFDPNRIFVEHILAVGFYNSFIHIVLSEEEDDKLCTPTHNDGDLEMVFNTNEFYKQKGKDPSKKSAQSPTITLKTQTSRSNALVAHPSRKDTNNSLGGRGDKNPSLEKIKSSQNLPLRKKRKTLCKRKKTSA